MAQATSPGQASFQAPCPSPNPESRCLFHSQCLALWDWLIGVVCKGFKRHRGLLKG